MQERAKINVQTYSMIDSLDFIIAQVNAYVQHVIILNLNFKKTSRFFLIIYIVDKVIGK